MSKLFTSRVNTGAVNLALLVLRVVFGGLMFTHGLSKLKGFSQMVDKFPDPLHVGQTVSLSLTIFAEALCAALVVVGLLTRLAAIPLVFCMVIVVFVVMKNAPLSQMEMGILFLAAFTAILFAGPGKYSLDHLIGK
ncbi:DoxX family protein [Chitinophaga filiformis]|uniref:DoxX family protein n=1 Tax=Chitinophaga filiformis TaxID=104663 RepID=UPI001F3900BF|nr:DoxX family protein [Chitinophaga filiformis]MCF6402737.1 DoxX family protein [Chitinophaga filiformis]MCF6403345.1 DoxX family protein [Chitinophaga filiformis]